MWIFGGVAAVAGLMIAVAAMPGGLSVARLGLGASDEAYVVDRSIDFLEDLRYKDFKKASTYHLPETQLARDIPEMIRRKFGIRHEVLDIRDFKVIGTDFDRAGNRARVRAMVYYRVLSDIRVREHEENNRDAEMLLYWFKQPDGKWVMELESSLR